MRKMEMELTSIPVESPGTLFDQRGSVIAPIEDCAVVFVPEEAVVGTLEVAVALRALLLRRGYLV